LTLLGCKEGLILDLENKVIIYEGANYFKKVLTKLLCHFTDEETLDELLGNAIAVTIEYGDLKKVSLLPDKEGISKETLELVEVATRAVELILEICSKTEPHQSRLKIKALIYYKLTKNSLLKAGWSSEKVDNFLSIVLRGNRNEANSYLGSNKYELKRMQARDILQVLGNVCIIFGP
jgi:hypothetical protein